MFRASYQLFGPPNKILSVESFVHMDIIFHVVLDLLDSMVRRLQLNLNYAGCFYVRPDSA